MIFPLRVDEMFFSQIYKCQKTENSFKPSFLEMKNEVFQLWNTWRNRRKCFRGAQKSWKKEKFFRIQTRIFSKFKYFEDRKKKNFAKIESPWKGKINYSKLRTSSEDMRYFPTQNERFFFSLVWVGIYLWNKKGKVQAKIPGKERWILIWNSSDWGKGFSDPKNPGKTIQIRF